MNNLSRNFILVGLVWVICGMIFGMWLGASHHPNFANSHAHMNLLGFVISVLFGLLHWAYPRLSASRLAVPQFFIYEIGVLSLVIGKIIVDRDGTETPMLIGGSLVVLTGAILMLIMFARVERVRS